MGLRDIAGDVARGTAGMWRGIADVLDPLPPRPVDRSPAMPTDPETAARDTGASSPVDVPEPDGPARGVGDGMLVPIDTWTRILEQLGHLHEAGQDLADARERAARAETENRFLREQLADLRTTERTGPDSSTARSAQALWARRPWSRTPGDEPADG